MRCVGTPHSCTAETACASIPAAVQSIAACCRAYDELQQQLAAQARALAQQQLQLQLQQETAAATGSSEADDALRAEVQQARACAAEAEQRAAAAEEQAARMQTLLRRACSRHVNLGVKVQWELLSLQHLIDH